MKPFQQSDKQGSFRHLLKSSASMYESSEFFRTITGIQLGQDLLTNQVSFSRFHHLGSLGNPGKKGRQLKGKQVKRYLSHQHWVLKKAFGKQFCIIRCRKQHLQAIEWKRYSRFTFALIFIGNIPQKSQ